MSTAPRAEAYDSALVLETSAPSSRRVLPPASQLEIDAAAHTNVIFWRGGEGWARIHTWAERIGARVPSDLLSLWAQCGGADLFESETLLSPFGDPLKGLDVDGVTAFHRNKGLGANWILFHVGIGVSGFRRDTASIAWFLGDAYSLMETFDSLDSWYKGVLRAEYGDRYGFSKLT
jgi:hypothetical protein